MDMNNPNQGLAARTGINVKITRVETIPLRVPLKVPFKSAGGFRSFTVDEDSIKKLRVDI